VGQSVDPNAFGQQVANLVARKEKAAMAEVKPLYTEAFDIAKAKNLELPAASVDDIYNFVAGERASDIFKTFPTIYNRVLQRFRPTTTEPSPILTAEGASMRPGGVEFSAATIEDLDSLKREINRQLAKTSDSADIRLLSELKSRVGGHIDSLDPDFVTAYRNADKAYLQKVGLPFDTATLAAVDRKKFVEQIAPAIIGNKSNVQRVYQCNGRPGRQSGALGVPRRFHHGSAQERRARSQGCGQVAQEERRRRLLGAWPARGIGWCYAKCAAVD